MTVKQLFLSAVTEGMILAQDVIDEYGRILMISGVPLKSEILKLLEKHGVLSVVVRTDKTINEELAIIEDVVSVKMRLNLMSYVKDAFSTPDGLANHLTTLQSNVEDVVYSLTQSKNALLYLTNIDDISNYLFMHSVNVGIFSIVIGIAMGLSDDELCLLGMGGLLHDVGKTKIPSGILDKEAKLTLAEFTAIKEHASLGYNILKQDVNLDYRIILMALQHHERNDGSGYPWGIVKNKIHPLSRIVAIADVYDALTTNRVYRSRLSSYLAMEIINNGNQMHFDPNVVKAFNKVAVPYPIGSNVTLNNGEKGNVIKLNRTNLVRPLLDTSNGTINLLYEPTIKIISAL